MKLTPRSSISSSWFRKIFTACNPRPKPIAKSRSVSVPSYHSQIWEWYDGTETDRDLAIGFGRGLQAVNILRNQEEDMEERGVSFMPEGWTRADLFVYARENLAKGD